MTDNNKVDQLDPDRELTIWEKNIRDQFVEQYYIDYDEIGACSRIGFTGAAVYEYVNRFKRDPYVQRKLIEYRENHACIEDAERTPRQLKIIMGLMKEAFNTGSSSSHSARVSALSKLASIENLDAPTKVQTTIEHSGNIGVEFDYSELTGDELKLVRKLLESRTSNSDG